MLHFLSNWFSQHRINMLTFDHQGAPIILHKNYAHCVFVWVDDRLFLIAIFSVKKIVVRQCQMQFEFAVVIYSC